MAHLYFAETLEGASVGKTVRISGQEARHAVIVGRTRRGDRLSLGDGQGTIVDGEVLSVERDELTLLVNAVRIESEQSPRTVLVQALAKGDRGELAIQAATELGVDAVVPWFASRSISRWEGSKVAKGVARWESIVREASKQSLRARIPKVHEPVSLTGLVDLAESSRTMALDPLGSTAIGDFLSTHPGADSEDIVIVVGPEGGITPIESQALQEAGALFCVLGPTVLRTSTAGPAALAVLNVALGRW